MRLVWDRDSEHYYETGVDHGVFYPRNAAGEYKPGVVWNGLTGVTESPSGAEATDLWADNIKYLSIRAAEEFGATVTAYTYPEEFAECDGSVAIASGVMIGQQARKSFGLSYRTVLGNDVKMNDYGYKLHLIYGCTASPSERGYSTVNDSPEAIEFSWELETTPVAVTGYKNTAVLTIDSTKVDPAALKAIEDILYGEEGDARMPMPDEVLSIMASAVPAVDTAADTTPTRYSNINVADLQENISIDAQHNISGKLKKIESNEGLATVFGAGKDNGHFLSLSLTAKDGATVKTMIDPSFTTGSSVPGEYKQVDDGFCIYKVTNLNQKIKVQTTKGDADTKEAVYNLSNLTLG